MYLPADLPIGTVIRNSADIYFDFQPGIHTNTTIAKLVDYDAINEPVQNVKGTDYVIYPNPAKDLVKVQFGHSRAVKHTAVLTNILGSKVAEITTFGQELELNTGSLPEGVYVLRLDEGKIVSKVIITR
jgi:hypothetical protein